MATSQAAIPNTSTPVSVTPLTPVQTPTTTSAEAVVSSQSQEEPIAAQPAEKTEEEKNTATGFEAILPPAEGTDEPMKMPGTNWMTRLTGTNTSVTGNNTNISAIHEIGNTIASAAGDGLYSAQSNNMVPRKAEPIMEYDSKKKPIRVALLEVHDTMNRLNSTIADMSANNQPTVVNNSTVVSSGGGGGGYPAYNSPRFTTAESDTINQMQAEYRKGAVV